MSPTSTSSTAEREHSGKGAIDPASWILRPTSCSAIATSNLHDPCIRPHAEYLALGVNAEERRTTYRTLFDEGIDHERLAAIRNYNQQQRALGSTRFQAEIEAALGRCMSVRPAHRPAKKPEGE